MEWFALIADKQSRRPAMQNDANAKPKCGADCGVTESHISACRRDSGASIRQAHVEAQRKAGQRESAQKK